MTVSATELLEVLREHDPNEFRAYCLAQKVPCHTCHNRLIAVMCVALLQFQDSATTEDFDWANRFLSSIRARVGISGGVPVYIQSANFGVDVRSYETFPAALLFQNLARG